MPIYTCMIHAVENSTCTINIQITFLRQMPCDWTVVATSPSPPLPLPPGRPFPPPPPPPPRPPPPPTRPLAAEEPGGTLLNRAARSFHQLGQRRPMASRRLDPGHPIRSHGCVCVQNELLKVFTSVCWNGRRFGSCF